MPHMANIGTYLFPTAASKKCMSELEKKSIFRQIATTIHAYGTDYKLMGTDTKDVATWVPEGGEIPMYNGMENFTKYNVGLYKAVAFVKLDEDFVDDATFDMENYLLKRFAKNLGRIEDWAFVNGTGVQMPTGILNDNGGAEIGVSTANVTFDDIHSLYFSVNSEYRKNGCWLMNDDTALYLHSLKDEHGNYLWRGDVDFLLGKPVHICNDMPSIGRDAKAVAFGDFSYYWIADRQGRSFKRLNELFATTGQVGFMATQRVDGKLILSEAIKVLAQKAAG